MRVLITRPIEDAEDLARALHERGHQTIVEPLLRIAFASGPPLALDGVQAILLTSANGARALALRTPERSTPVLAVGPATADAARGAGFTDVRTSDGDGVAGLAAFAARTLSPSAGSLLHVAGKVVAGDLGAALAQYQFKVHRQILYEAHPADSLSGALTAELAAGLIDAATFFSPRTAALFAELAAEENLGPACRSVAAHCLSDAVANALASLHFREIRVAERPTAEALLKTFG